MVIGDGKRIPNPGRPRTGAGEIDARWHGSDGKQTRAGPGKMQMIELISWQFFSVLTKVAGVSGNSLIRPKSDHYLVLPVTQSLNALWAFCSNCWICQRSQMDFLVETWICQVVLCISRYKTGQTGSRPKQGKMQVKQLWSTVGPASSAPPDISRLFTRTHHHEYCSQAHITKNIVQKQIPPWILFTSTRHQEYCSQAHTTMYIGPCQLLEHTAASLWRRGCITKTNNSLFLATRRQAPQIIYLNWQIWSCSPSAVNNKTKTKILKFSAIRENSISRKEW